MAAFLLLAGCTRLPSEERPTAGPTPVGSGSLRIAIPAAAGTLDPRELDSPESVLLASQLFDGLVSYEPGTGAVTPAVAQSWDVLDGASRFVFHLRQGLTFHDGTPVTAQSFVDGWTRLADPGTPSPYAFLLESVRGFREFHTTLEAPSLSGLIAIDELTLEVTLIRSWHDFVAVLGHPSLSPVPPSASEPGYPVLPTGNGPYRLTEELQPGRPVTMASYPRYSGRRPSVAEVLWSVETAPEESWPRFLRGDLDVAPIPGSLIEDARSEFGSA
ncbi:MAG TPA: ABC transporter substrate-binding protein, partial [Actinomycetota bacterium]|nr:ABC transporter substrate-binding protein [Actinomycetota bacterium]